MVRSEEIILSITLNCQQIKPKYSLRCQRLTSVLLISVNCSENLNNQHNPIS